MIGIINYGMGNIGSVYNTLNFLGYDVDVITEPFSTQLYSHLIIPGVGSYSDAMLNINKKKLLQPIIDFIATGKPVMGICLGMHILSTKGFEGGESLGLGFIDGCVDKINVSEGLVLPHVGWNNLEVNKAHVILSNVKEDIDFYFIHSYCFIAESDNDVIAYTNYGEKIPAIIARKNVVGIQFHPEKSQDYGLEIIETFAQWDGIC